jgi:uncharacterized caspase-like protein
MRCVAALFLVIGCLAATQASAERRVALVVGNSRYEHTAALANPHNDAEDMARALEQVGFEVKVGFDLDEVRFAGLIDEFARALDGADVGLFFYAGHGLQINDKNYLVSTGAKLESAFLVPSETIELDAVIRLMESKTGTNLVFLDACRNNPLADSLKRNLAATSRAVSVGRGLAPVAPAGHDTLVVYSAAPGEQAADGAGRNSPFAASLLQHLPEPGLEVSVMLKDVAADVRRETDNKQRPQQLSDMTRKFYFVKADAPAQAAAPAAPGVAGAPSDPVELAFWQSASAANECESIRAYMHRYPNGSFADLALIAERRLCKPGTEIAVAPAQNPAPAAPAAPPAAAPVPSPAAPTAPAQRAWIGVQSQDVTKDIADSRGLREARGALVAETDAGGPAAKAGVKPGDVITAVNGRDIGDRLDLARTLGDLPPGSDVVLSVIRWGADQQQMIKLTAGIAPAQREANADMAVHVAPLLPFDAFFGPRTGIVPLLGITVAAQRDGVAISSIDPNGPNARTGLGNGDVILQIDGMPVNELTVLSNAAARARNEGRPSVLMRVKSSQGVRYVATWIGNPQANIFGLPDGRSDQPPPVFRPPFGQHPGGRGRR